MVTLIFIILVVETCVAQCPENRDNTCCDGYEWDEVLGQCIRCKPGSFGLKCNKTCQYPHFGDGCQHSCSCSKELCDIEEGCLKNDTTKDFYTKDDVKDYRPTPINIRSTNLLEQFRSWFNKKTTSLTIICIVGLVLITIIIYFTRKVIHNRYSPKRRKNSYQCPNDRLSEPVHYEMISNTVV